LTFSHSYDSIIRMTDTRGKILNAAESLFGENGYAATSLRHIIGKAGVNLAAIHYHFGSKQDLLDQVILRKAGPLNERRVALLEQFEAEAAPAPAGIEKILEAFIAPAVLVEKSPAFVKLMGRVHSEGLMPEFARRNFQPIIGRFFSAIRRALPDMPMEELTWKAHFALGAMAFTLSIKPDFYAEISCEPPQIIAKRLVAFVSSGFRSQIAMDHKHEVDK
jgi:AcrR family transcriptional regulator